MKFNVRKEWWEAGEGEMVAPGKNNNLVEEPGQDYGQKLLQSMEDNIETLKRENKLLRAILQKAGIEL